MKILIVEDELLAAEDLEKMILSINSSIKVMKIIGTIRETVSWLASNNPDLIFMDIKLSDGLSFEIFKQVNITISIVFTTSYNKYSIKVFEVNSIDFLQNPIKEEELKSALNKYNIMHEHFSDINYNQIADVLLKNANPYRQRFSVRIGQKIKVLKTNEIAYIHSIQGFSIAYTGNGSSIPLEESLDKLELVLDPDIFFRVNRQFIINISSIQEMHVMSNRTIKIELKPSYHHDCIVSIMRIKLFKKWLDALI